MDIDILTTDIVHISMCESIHATNGNWYCMLTKADVGGTRSVTALHISQLLDWLQADEGYSSIQVGQPSPNTYFTSSCCKILLKGCSSFQAGKTIAV